MGDIKAKQTGKTSTGLTGESSVSDYINIYAPSFENDTKSYIHDIMKQLKISKDTKIKDINPRKLAKAISKIESGTNIE